MRNLAITILILANFYSHAQQLTRICENGKIGYIDSNGRVVIPPIFPSAGEFAEGLAPARTGGLYGYIDTTGKYVIQPQFDYAEPFDEGLAVVYNDNIANYIDHKANYLSHTSFVLLTALHKNRGLAKTRGGNNVLVNQYGDMLTDSIYTYMYMSLNDDVILAYADTEQSVLDLEGNEIVPQGLYTDIDVFNNGYARVSNKKAKGGPICGLINTSGKLLFKTKRDSIDISPYTSDDIINISIKKKGAENDYQDCYYSYVNTKGEIPFIDTQIIYAGTFSGGRASVKTNDGWFLIDKKGKRLNKQPYYNIEAPFSNGKALAQRGDSWYLLDTNGQQIKGPFRYDRTEHFWTNNESYLFGIRDTIKPYNAFYGIANMEGETIINPFMQDFNEMGFQKGILSTRIDGKESYVNKSGKVIWSHDKENEQPRQLDIDYMYPSHYTVYDYYDYKADTNDLSSTPHLITAANRFPSNTLSLIVKPDVYIAEDNIISMRAFIANNTNEDIRFDLHSSKLYMTMQAKDKDGTWKDIEYIQSSFCGNSYYGNQLQAGMYWSVPVPVYQGSYQTRLRLKLYILRPDIEQETPMIYSNSFVGQINPAQFWRESDRYSN